MHGSGRSRSVSECRKTSRERQVKDEKEIEEENR